MSQTPDSADLRRLAIILAAAALAVVLGGCGARTAAASPSVTTVTARPIVVPSQPAPVDTSATLGSDCVMGYESPTVDSNGFPQSEYSGFRAGAPKGSTIDGNYWAPAMAYQLTLTDNSGNTADVTGFAVVFYDASGTEAGSDQQTGTGFITPGQSLTWTELASAAVDGTGDGGNDPNIPAAAATCQLVQWYQ